MPRVLEHLFFWFAFILFKAIVNYTDTTPALPETGVSGMINKFLIILYSQLPYFFIYIPVAYVLFNFIDRYFRGSLKLSATLLYSILVFIVSVPLLDVVNHKFILPVVYNNLDYPLKFDLGSQLYYSLNMGSVLGIAGSFKLVRKQLHSRVREQTLKSEKAEAELQFLKAQVSPHFLFNTLNNIYSLARMNSDQTAEAVMKLSKLLRFMLYDASGKYILLSDELRLIEDYIELEKLRYTDRLKVKFNKKIDNHSQRIAPLILIHFVENAFKHGAGQSRFDIKIEIDIELKDAVLSASFMNTKGIQAHNHEKQIGLSNTRRQLELLYPAHELIIDSENELFIVKLTIPLST